MSKKIVEIIFGVRWQAQRDTAFEYLICSQPAKQSAVAATTTPAGLPGWGPRFALPAHSKDLLSRKSWRPLFHECPYAFAAVLRLEATHLRFHFILEHLFQSVMLACVDGVFCGRN